MLENNILVSTEEVGDTIELTYIQTSNIILLSYPPKEPERKVFKIIYSCIDGKWNKSEPIYGEIIQRTEERYKF